jgi:hypothetical protein
MSDLRDRAEEYVRRAPAIEQQLEGRLQQLFVP